MKDLVHPLAVKNQHGEAVADEPDDLVNDRKGFLLLRPQPQFGRKSYGKLRPQANCDRKSQLRPNETVAAEVNNCGRKRLLRPQ